MVAQWVFAPPIIFTFGGRKRNTNNMYFMCFFEFSNRSSKLRLNITLMRYENNLTFSNGICCVLFNLYLFVIVIKILNKIHTLVNEVVLWFWQAHGVTKVDIVHDNDFFLLLMFYVFIYHRKYYLNEYSYLFFRFALLGESIAQVMSDRLKLYCHNHNEIPCPKIK